MRGDSQAVYKLRENPEIWIWYPLTPHFFDSSLHALREIRSRIPNLRTLLVGHKGVFAPISEGYKLRLFEEIPVVYIHLERKFHFSIV